MTRDCLCPEQYPDWHQKDIDLGGHCIHSIPIASFLNMPMAYEMYLGRQQQEIDSLKLKEIWPGLVLTRTGLWRGTIIRLLEESSSLSRHVSHLPHPFHVHGYLHQGNVSTIRSAIRTVQMQLLDSGRMPKELYLCHLTCPHCSADRGGDRILVLRRWQYRAGLNRRSQPDSRT